MNHARFLGLFLDEVRQHLAQARATLERFQARPQSPETLRALMRHCHSMKGMAATMGFEPFVDLAHRMEGLLRELEDRPRMWSNELAPLFAEALDQLGGWAEQVGEGRAPEHDAASRTLVARLDSLLNEKLGADRDSPDGRPEGPARAVSALWTVRLGLRVSSASPTHRILSTLKRVGRLGRVLRVRPPQLPFDQTPAAMDLEFELASARTPQALKRLLGQLAWVSAVALDPIERRPVSRPPIEMPSEWTRVPAEALDWIADNLRELALRHTLHNAAGSPDDPDAYLIKRVYDRVTELRLVPMMSLGHRLEPAMRDAARRDGKLVRFALSGGDIGLERALLDRLVEPLRQLVRNAVVHGIEAPGERLAEGKPEEGLIRLTVALHGDRLHLELTDDGRGMDAAALRRCAVSAGEIDAAEADALSVKESLLLAFRAAVTTRETADRLAGRGAGLDVVAREFLDMESTLDVGTVAGEGTRFTFDLPLRRAIVRALVFSRAGQTFAIPLKAIRRATSSAAPPRGLGVLDLAPDGSAPAVNGFYLELDRAEKPLVLVADEVFGRRDLWLQPLTRPLAESTYVNGAAITDDGSLALMIDPTKLAVAEPVAG